MAGCSWFFESEKMEIEEKVALDLPSIPYKTMIKPKVPEDVTPELETHLNEISLLVKLESRPPTSLHALYHRIRNDVERLKQALRERGYFDGQVDFVVAEKADPITVSLTYSLGKRYKISGLTVTAKENTIEPLQLIPSKVAKTLELQEGEEVDLVRIQSPDELQRKNFLVKVINL